MSQTNTYLLTTQNWAIAEQNDCVNTSSQIDQGDAQQLNVIFVFKSKVEAMDYHLYSC